jgi:hypothetical protein
MENEARTLASEDRLATCRVCEKLRRPLVHLVGVGGFSSLLQRALSLAQRESPALARVEVLSDGGMAGLEGPAVEAVPILIAHLIQLLITFIGESLTRTLLQDIWPEIQNPDEPMSEDGYEK